MRTIVAVLLLVPAAVVAVSLQPVTVLPDDGKVLPGTQTGKAPSREARFTIGAVDTVGGTTYDWQANGPALRMLVRSPGRGVHALFMYSAEMVNTTFPDRNMRYNFYDYATPAWNWIDPDFMQSGVNTFQYRTGFGSLSAETSGVAVISAHHATTSLAPVLARDAAPGAGIFEYGPGEPTIDNFAWAYVGTGQNLYHHLAMIDYTSQDNLYWSRSTSWGNWDGAVSFPSPMPEPMFPDHNIANSRVPGSNKVCITWSNQPGGFGQFPGYYRESPDGGDNWDPPVDLGFPPAFTPGSETIPSYHITSLFPLYDKEDQLHVVACVEPVISDTNYWTPGEIWHWCPANPDTWSLIRRSFDNGTPQAAVGYNAMICDRPSLGEDEWGNLFVAWEEFDGQNYEPGPPDRLRADIWYSASTDNGQTWDASTQITDGGTVTYRFPSILDPIGDTVMVAYLIDQTAGFFLYAEGPATLNPVVVQKWMNPYAGGVGGRKDVVPRKMEVTALPNPFAGSTRLCYDVPRTGDVSLEVYDASGRPVRTLAGGRKEPGRFTVTWDGRSDGGALVPNGVYLYRFGLDGKQMTGKLTLSR
jgi:hypothetical protein